MASSQIPYAIEQGIFFTEQGKIWSEQGNFVRWISDQWARSFALRSDAYLSLFTKHDQTHYERSGNRRFCARKSHASIVLN